MFAMHLRGWKSFSLFTSNEARMGIAESLEPPSRRYGLSNSLHNLQREAVLRSEVAEAMEVSIASWLVADIHGYF
jgi:hypothetical protein